MSQNNTIRKSDKKFIRTEKARIRATFLDVKKQQELINDLYKKFLPDQKDVAVPEVKKEESKKVEVKPAVAKSSGAAKKVKKVTSKK